MNTEVDHAVFCQILIEAVFEPNTDFSSPAADRDVREIMTRAISPADKLYELVEFFNEVKRVRG